AEYSGAGNHPESLHCAQDCYGCEVPPPRQTRQSRARTRNDQGSAGHTSLAVLIAEWPCDTGAQGSYANYSKGGQGYQCGVQLGSTTTEEETDPGPHGI